MAFLTSAKRRLADPEGQEVPTPTSIRVVEYAPNEHKELWDSFVLRSMNGTAFHLQQFLAYHPTGKFDFHHLLFFDHERLVAVLPGGFSNQKKKYESPLGASYGSFVVEDIDAATALAIVWAFEDHVEVLGIEEVNLTSAPVLYQPVLSQNLEFALLYCGYAYQRHYISHMTELPESGDPFDGFDPAAKRDIRSSKSHYPGVTIEEITAEHFENALEEYYPIIVSNKARRDARPTHSLDDLKRLNELLPNLIKLWLLRLNGELIAGSLIFLPNQRVPLSFYQAMRYEFSYVRPIYLLSEVMMQWAQKNGYRYFDLGVSQDTSDDNPMTPALSLIKFKEKFNSRGILRSTLAKVYKK